MSKKLSRRDFLKLTGATSAGLALSAFGVKPTEPPTITLTSTITSTLTITQTPYPTATLTPTPLPPLPQLYIDGANIRRRDTGEMVQLKGVVMQNPVYGEGGKSLKNQWNC